MTGFTKIAITVPTETYTVLERLRRRLGKSRSAAVTLALEEWIRSSNTSDADRRYIEGYLRMPETDEEVRTATARAVQAVSHWDTWSPGAPSRAADSHPRPARPKPPKRSRR